MSLPDHLAALHASSGLPMRSWSADEYTSLISDKKTILVEANGGFAIGTIILDEAELLMIVVPRSIRRQGHGTHLLHLFEQGAQIRGASCIFLEVGESNKAAQALYHALEYTKIGERAHYYRYSDGQTETALILKKDFPEIV